jgi:ankyrin repeat protein
LACYWGAVDAARLLIDAGADVTVVSQDGFLVIHPLGSAVATPDIPNPSDEEDRVLALVDLLLDRGADVNARRRDGLSALHTAAYRGRLRVIRRLVERGADPRLAGHDDGGPHAGVTPLQMAVGQGQADAARLLENLTR